MLILVDICCRFLLLGYVHHPSLLPIGSRLLCVLGAKDLPKMAALPIVCCVAA